MKIVHTSDWHAGRIWKREDRIDELRATLGSMVSYVAEHEVDLVLMSGDVFDSRSPSGKAEQLVAQVFRDIAATGARCVVIGGNHDSSTRLGAWKLLAELAGVMIVPRPAARDRGGLVEVPSRDGTETALIAAIPFAAASQLVAGTVMADDDTASYQRYSEAFAGIVRHLTEGFRDDTINLIMAHAHLDGAVLAHSERTVHTGEQWAAQPSTLPHTAHYVALGHIHKPQRVAAPAPTYYAGSPLQLDFGELGETKTFNAITARAGLPTKVDLVEYAGGRALRHFRGSLDQLAATREEYGECWLRAEIELPERHPDLSRAVRELVPNAVVIHAVLPEAPAPDAPAPRANLSMEELFARYYAERGRPLSDDVRRAFAELYDEVTS